MAKTTTNSRTRTTANSDDELMVRLRESLTFLQLSHTKRQLDELLSWARRERPSPLALLEHVLGQEVDTKRDARIERRVHSSGLKERKLLGAFDWDFQPTLDKATVLELARLDNVIAMPHAASNTVTARERMALWAAQSIIDCLDGRIPQHVVNREVLEQLNHMT